MLKFVFENALVLDYKPLGERRFSVGFLTKEQGRFVGVLNGKMPPVCGSLAHIQWQARLAEQMGSVYVENTKNFTALYLHDKNRLACIACVCALLKAVLPERQSFSRLYALTLSFLEDLGADDFMVRYVLWELDLLSAIGFGLDLSGCAGGGDGNDLAYVSPNTGRAVSREKGAPYHHKLLPLPAFLWKNKVTPDQEEIKQGLQLTGFFLERHFLNQKIVLCRHMLLKGM